MNRYTRAVIAIEWPAQAEGHVVRAGDRYLDELQRLAVSLRPSGHELAHAALAIPDMAARRTGTTFGAETTAPSGIVWFVVIVGGAITIAFSSFPGAPSVRMHLSMCCMLALSGVLVLVLTIALSNPFRGDFRVSTTPSTTSCRGSAKHPNNARRR